MKALKNTIRKILNKFGYEIVLKEKVDGLDLGNWMLKVDIKTIIDIGSNEGQFIIAINRLLPGRKIYAFEPIKSCFEKLVKNTAGLNVVAHNFGLSDVNQTESLNISENLVSSSILPMEKLHEDLYPESHYISKNSIELKRLDDVIDATKLDNNILLKMDVQGYENKVIAGGQHAIQAAAIVITEFAYQPIYKGQWLFDETYKYFTGNGFTFVGFADQVLAVKTGIPIYGDAIFVKSQLIRDLYN